ncbi:hypothetical protein TGVAND_313710 [Toxoplasma gondii VAND]|uniref:Uncharacterized protein n=1 Tax=Toxoplasma gondii VAND TaxID=933077 RepID=A0A086QBA1_TOXGO|nr:hypothetical protein TGVAND_313710 [Toxoplasma gondii VAND]
MAGKTRGEFLLRSTASQPFASVEISLEQRLQDFLIQHDFRTLENIAVADLRGLGLSVEDAGKIHAACAATLLALPPRFPPPVFASSALSPFLSSASPAFVTSTAAEILGYETRERRDACSTVPSASLSASSPASASVSVGSESERNQQATRKRERSPDSRAQTKSDGGASPQKEQDSRGEEEQRFAQQPRDGLRPAKQRRVWREGQRNHSHDRKTHWTSGSQNLDHLLGGRGWREGMVTELFGGEGGATLTEVLVSCLLQALCESKHASVLFVSCRGFFPLSRLRALATQSVRRRNKASHSTSCTTSPPASSATKTEHAAEADRDALSLLRRFHMTSCFSLDDLATALRETLKEVEQARVHAVDAETAGRKRREDKRRRPSRRAGDPEHSATREGTQKAGDDRRKEEKVNGTRGGDGATAVVREAEEDAAATEGDTKPEEKLRRTKNCDRARKGRNESPGRGAHLAAVAIDGLSLLLLPHAILDGSSALQPVWRLLRQFAASSSALVLTTNHTVASETSAEGHANFFSNPSSLGRLPFSLPPATMKRPGLGVVWSRCAPHQQLQIDLLASLQLHAPQSSLGNDEGERSSDRGYLARVTVVKSHRQATGLSTLIWLNEKGIQDPPLEP